MKPNLLIVDDINVFESYESFLLGESLSGTNDLIIMEKKILPIEIDQIPGYNHSHIVFLTEESKELMKGENVHSIYRRRLLSELAPLVSDLVGDGGYININIPKGSLEAQYLKIEIKSLEKVDSFPCDIYLALTKTKFVKIINSGAGKSESSLETYISKGVKEVWLTKEDFYNHANFFFPKDQFQLEENENPEKKAARAIEHLHTTVEGLGFSKQAIKNVDNLIGQMSGVVKSKDILKIIGRMNNDAGSFLYSHSFLIALIGSNFLRKQEWNSAETQMKLVMASMFHDLGFQNKKNVIFESTNPKELGKKLKLKDRMDIVSHVDRIVSILEKNPEIHVDIIRMVQSHHYDREKISTLGNTQFPRLCSVFNMSHDASVRLIKSALNSNKFEKIISDLEEDFSYGPFKSIVKDFCQVLKETTCKS